MISLSYLFWHFARSFLPLSSPESSSASSSKRASTKRKSLLVHGRHLHRISHSCLSRYGIPNCCIPNKRPSQIMRKMAF